ncbi:hypothetical protein MRX96_054779 [Rhipicephalus microplus]
MTKKSDRYGTASTDCRYFVDRARLRGPHRKKEENGVFNEQENVSARSRCKVFRSSTLKAKPAGPCATGGLLDRPSRHGDRHEASGNKTVRLHCSHYATSSSRKSRVNDFSDDANQATAGSLPRAAGIAKTIKEFLSVGIIVRRKVKSAGAQRLG